MLGKGAVLVENNLTWDNGGRGIQVNSARNVLVRNNTCAWNERTSEAPSGSPTSDLRAVTSENCVFENNIVVAREGQDFRDNWKSKNIAYTDNLLYGYVKVWPGVGESNLVGSDPMFKNASLGAAMPDFRLRPESPAIGRAAPGSSPAVDIRERPRPRGVRGDLGAFAH